MCARTVRYICSKKEEKGGRILKPNNLIYHSLSRRNRAGSLANRGSFLWILQGLLVFSSHESSLLWKIPAGYSISTLCLQGTSIMYTSRFRKHGKISPALSIFFTYQYSRPNEVVNTMSWHFVRMCKQVRRSPPIFCCGFVATNSTSSYALKSS